MFVLSIPADCHGFSTNAHKQYLLSVAVLGIDPKNKPAMAAGLSELKHIQEWIIAQCR